MKNTFKKISKIPKNALWLLIAVLLVANAVAAIVVAQKFEWADPRNNPYPLIDISRNFIPQEEYIVNIQPLRESLNKMVDEYGRDSVSLYVEFLNTGANISINPDLYLWPASLSKLPIAMAVMNKIEDGEWEIDNELVLMEGDKDERSGAVGAKLSRHPYGTTLTIEKLLQELLTNSDNTAFNILTRNLGADDIDKLIINLGLEELSRPNGQISAKEYSRLYRSLYTASFLNRRNSQLVLEMLDASTFNDFLARGIPDEIPFPHKYGEQSEANIFADSGIVYLPNRPYLITVVIQGEAGEAFQGEKEKASEFMHKVSAGAYNYFSEI